MYHVMLLRCCILLCVCTCVFEFIGESLVLFPQVVVVTRISYCKAKAIRGCVFYQLSSVILG